MLTSPLNEINDIKNSTLKVLDSKCPALKSSVMLNHVLAGGKSAGKIYIKFLKTK